MIYNISVNYGELKFSVNALSFDHAQKKAIKYLGFYPDCIDILNNNAYLFDSSLPLIKIK